MTRAEAFALIIQHGGKPRGRVTKDTNALIVGGLGWPLEDDGRPSKSLAQAKIYGVPIASERRFLQWVGKMRQPQNVTLGMRKAAAGWAM